MVDFKKMLADKKFYSYERDGITQGLIGMWLECRQKAKYFIQGYSGKGSSFALTNGTIGHGVLQYVYDGYRTGKIKTIPTRLEVKKYTAVVEKIFMKENPRASKRTLEDLDLALMYAEALMPLYFQRWKDDFKKYQWLKVESAFKLPFTTSDGRKTFIRGKMDGAFKSNGNWLFESKFKSIINDNDLVDTLGFDTQCMVYLWALMTGYKLNPQGVLYNVVRRPGLKIKKGEALVQFSKRVQEDIEARPEWYFYRYEIFIDKDDIKKWTTTLDAMVMEFMDWCDGTAATYRNTGACVTKYGRCWGLTTCADGNFHTMEKRPTVFRELAEDL